MSVVFSRRHHTTLLSPPYEIDDESLSQNEIEDSFMDTLQTVNTRLRAQNEKTSSLFMLCYGGYGVVDQADRL